MNSSQHSPNGLSRAERLRGRGAVSELFEGGESGFVYPIRYVWREATSIPQAETDHNNLSSVLFTVPKRFHKRANKRNLLRRRIKEAYRLQKDLLNNNIDTPLNIALIYSSKEIVEYDKISRSVAKALRLIAEEIARKKLEQR